MKTRTKLLWNIAHALILQNQCRAWSYKLARDSMLELDGFCAFRINSGLGNIFLKTDFIIHKEFNVRRRTLWDSILDGIVNRSCHHCLRLSNFVIEKNKMINTIHIYVTNSLNATDKRFWRLEEWNIIRNERKFANEFGNISWLTSSQLLQLQSYPYFLCLCNLLHPHHHIMPFSLQFCSNWK